METGLWVEQERSVWKLLPLHPPPEVLESKTSYLIRLAEANGLQSVNELEELAGGARLGLQCPDYPTPIWASLAQMTNVPVARWFDMTFFHLVGRFGRTLHSNAVNRFLAGGIAPFLRYCPLCLAEHIPAYYSLLWRILLLAFMHGTRGMLPRSLRTLPVPSSSLAKSSSTHKLSGLPGRLKDLQTYTAQR